MPSDTLEIEQWRRVADACEEIADHIRKFLASIEK
jgi:hypothetical protein